MLYNVVSGTQQSDSCVCVCVYFFSRFFSFINVLALFVLLFGLLWIFIDNILTNVAWYVVGWFFFRFFSIMNYYKILNIVPCAIQLVLVYLFFALSEGFSMIIISWKLKMRYQLYHDFFL